MKTERRKKNMKKRERRRKKGIRKEGNVRVNEIE